MNTQPILLSLTIMLSASTIQAGVLTSGKWMSSGCGSAPEDPITDANIKMIQAWQQKAQSFVNCVVNEANADNNLIAESANAEHTKFKATVSKINAEVQATKQKLDGK
jgi:hypothetical protein